MLETEAGGLDILLGVARPEKEGVRLQIPSQYQLYRCMIVLSPFLTIISKQPEGYLHYCNGLQQEQQQMFDQSSHTQLIKYLVRLETKAASPDIIKEPLAYLALQACNG